MGWDLTLIPTKDHGKLIGLADDDHTQYLKADGTRNAAKLLITDGAGHYLQIPQLTTTQRDALTPVNGMLIYNSTTAQFERYQAAAWGAFAGGFFDKFRDFIPWVSLDGFTIGGTTTYQVAALGSVIYIYAGTDAAGKAWVYSTEKWINLAETGKDISVEFIIKNCANPADLVFFMRFCSLIHDPPEDNDSHFGFFVAGGYIGSGVGTGEKNSMQYNLLACPTGDQSTRLRAVFRRGSNCKFYVNDVLACTIANNLPTVASYYLQIALQVVGTPGVRTFSLGRVLIEKEI